MKMHVEADLLFSVGLTLALLFQALLPILFRRRHFTITSRVLTAFGAFGIAAFFAGGLFFGTKSLTLGIVAIAALVTSWRMHARDGELP